MTTISSLKKIVSFLDMSKLDNKGGLLIPTELKIKDDDFFKYRHLQPDWNMPEVSSCDLPPEFSKNAVKLVDLFNETHIAIIHNHPKRFYSPPSARNFQILELEFEDYELISSHDSLWILESKDHISNKDIIHIKKNIQFLYDDAAKRGYSFSNDERMGFKMASDLYGELLLKYINNMNSISI